MHYYVHKYRGITRALLIVGPSQRASYYLENRVNQLSDGFQTQATKLARGPRTICLRCAHPRSARH